YLYGGLGAVLDVKNWKENFIPEPQDECSKRLDDKSYEILGIKLNLDGKVNLMGDASCVVGHETKAAILILGVHNDKYKYEKGNSAFVQASFVFYEPKVDEATIESVIGVLANKPVVELLEIQDSDHPRFSVIDYKADELVKDEHMVCKMVTGEVNDSEAINIPRGQDHLIQKDFYKSCYLKDHKLFVWGFLLEQLKKFLKA
ncbi:MAG: hypothetical protein O3B09_00560, partial [Proteobacteria bacterium]|nr:hypothetical protein [Pseudomonadota bacterium]